MSVGDQVKWTSQSAGITRTKRGEVVEVVLERESPHTLLQSLGSPRDHQSYVVRAYVEGADKKRYRKYWPKVSHLMRVFPGPEVNDVGSSASTTA